MATPLKITCLLQARRWGNGDSLTSTAWFPSYLSVHVLGQLSYRLAFSAAGILVVLFRPDF